MWQFFCHIWWFSFFFFLTFNGFIFILCDFNITCDSSFVTLSGSLTFFSHLPIPSSHYVVPTSHVTILLSHLVVLFFFFLTFDGSILILYNSNIRFDSTFVTFGGTFFFSSLLILSSLHCIVPTSHVTILLSHSVVPLFFFSHLSVPSSHCTVTTSHVTVLLWHLMVLFLSFSFFSHLMILLFH